MLSEQLCALALFTLARLREGHQNRLASRRQNIGNRIVASLRYHHLRLTITRRQVGEKSHNFDAFRPRGCIDLVKCSIRKMGAANHQPARFGKTAQPARPDCSLKERHSDPAAPGCDDHVMSGSGWRRHDARADQSCVNDAFWKERRLRKGAFEGRKTSIAMHQDEVEETAHDVSCLQPSVGRPAALENVADR